ncbi:hypothetical protein N1851_026795 [Merluccius polli]|uniref:Endonuclease/exonuclease/phosphatase domain-containing protein n=1 Tax=Merluccius polli TaxID=89951 RepID=A0AA47MB47_MERPO|nr:hypothetical protein N1851_026795 [Merluccius polli]
MQLYFNKCLSESLSCSSRLSASDYKYSQQALLDIRKSKDYCALDTTTESFIKELGLLRQPAATPTATMTAAPTKRRRKRCARKQKRGKRGGIRARLAASPSRPAIPSIILANVRSLDNKMDHIRLLRSANRTVSNCCVLVFTETWLNDNIPDSAVQLEQLTCYRADRAHGNGCKQRGGGVCVYIRDAWCQDAMVVCRHCSPLAKFMIIKCRPFYLPREFTAVLLIAAYIPPTSSSSDRNAALNELYQAISEQQTAHPDGFAIVAGDFNHANLKTVLPKLYQHVNFPTREKNTLDLVYTSLKGAYKASPLPHIGLSDHLTVMLMPA